MDPRFQRSGYVLHKKLLKLFGGEFSIFDCDTGELLFFSRQKAFKLREDIRIFADANENSLLLTIKARQILDVGATYDVADAASGETVGALHRKALKSLVRDEWIVLDATGREIGALREDSMRIALVRRFLFPGLPQAFTMEIDCRLVARFQQNWNFFAPKLGMDFTSNTAGLLDPRLGVAAAVLLAAIEGRQQKYD